MSRYSAIASRFIQKIKTEENLLKLINTNCRSQFFLQEKPTNKVCLFLHGFTATPEQFIPIGKAFFNHGYNVLIPLLPGHGLAGNWDKHNPPPLPESQEIYKQFAIQWLEFAQQIGTQVIVSGLSGGSTLAAWLALERPQQIYKALLFAPYLSSHYKIVDLIIEIFNFYFEWKTKPGLAHFGYDGFLMPSLRVFFDMGTEVLSRAEDSLAAPMLIISSESDRAVGKEEHQALFEAVIKYQPLSWYYCFDNNLDIQHNMMTKAEGNQHLDLVINLAKAYVESNLTWAEFAEIGDYLKQGYSFDTVVSKLNLSQRVSAALAQLWTSM